MNVLKPPNSCIKELNMQNKLNIKASKEAVQLWTTFLGRDGAGRITLSSLLFYLPPCLLTVTTR
ncbi:hypothetical protein E2C01_047738 [Portunus trituberculatus]|uniref:Uncharacterized protein n=1 Tax=Portunus trituberculatus TaxID=210409 RepID=A0A5B7G8P7_PORTR|nr:hypothetical protein [Portunus trituberculatus]